MRFTFIGRRVKRIFEWQNFIRMRDWFESNVILNRSARSGKFQSRYVPHADEIFEDIDRQEVTIVTLKSASQVIKTTIGMGFILKYIDTDPTDSMIMIPRASDLKIYSENKLKAFIEGVPIVKRKFLDFKSTEKVRDNSYIYRFAGGVLNLLSSNNPKMISVKYALFDEVSEFSRGKVGEALERMKSYLMFGYKALLVSTQEHEDDEINFYFNSSEVKKQYFMYCKGCKGHFYPDERHIKYLSVVEYKAEVGIDEKYELKSYEIISDYMPYVAKRGYLECPHCNHHIEDTERKVSILTKKLKWFQVVPISKDEEGGVVEYEVAQKPKTTYSTVGFDVNTLCMYNVPLSESIGKLIKASVSKDKDIELDYFYRGYLNKIYKPNKADVLSKNDILLLSNGLERGVVPNDTWRLILTADNQKDHLFYKVIAIGYDNYEHTVQHGKLQGYGDNEDFDALEELMFSDFYDENGEVRYIDNVGIDRRGYVSEKDGIDRIADVDAFVLKMINRLKLQGVVEYETFIFAMQGVANIAGDKYYKFNKVKRQFQDEEVELNILVHNNLLVKNRLNSLLTRSIDKAKAKDGEDALNYDRELYYINQDIVDDAIAKGKSTAEDYERMMTSEQFGFEVIDGRTAKQKSWFKRQGIKRNDYWDCSAMGVALAIMLGIEFAVRPVEDDAEEALKVLKKMF